MNKGCKLKVIISPSSLPLIVNIRSIFNLPILNPFWNILLPLAFALRMTVNLMGNFWGNFYHGHVLLWLPLVWKQANNSSEKELTDLTDCHLLLEKSNWAITSKRGFDLPRMVAQFHMGNLEEEQRTKEVENGAEVFLERWVNMDIQYLLVALENRTCGLFWKTGCDWRGSSQL